MDKSGQRLQINCKLLGSLYTKLGEVSPPVDGYFDSLSDLSEFDELCQVYSRFLVDPSALPRDSMIPRDLSSRVSLVMVID